MTLSKTLFGMAIAAGVLALSSLGASAAIVFNAGNVCWHAHQRYDYPPGSHGRSMKTPGKPDLP
jgi:hypothetical protein